MNRFIIRNRDIKIVKAKDFDNAAFKRGEFDIIMCSPESVRKTLRFLSEQGYMWGCSKTSLLKDTHMKERLLEIIGNESVYITIDDEVPNVVLLSSAYLLYTNGAVEIDFEEDKNMITFEKVNAKDFDWKLFHDDRVAIVVDNRDMGNLNKVMKLLNDAGYYWAGNTPLSAKHAKGYKAIIDGLRRHITYLSTSGREHDHAVYWSEGCNGREHPVKIIFNEHTNNDKIIITNDGKTTTATLYSNGKKSGIGTAICHDDDKFDIYAGARLALDRLEKGKKESEMSDWEWFVKGEVNMRVPKKYIRNFLDRAAKDDLRIWGTEADWCLRCLEQDGDSIVVFVDYVSKKHIILVETLRRPWSKTVDYIPGMK